MLDVTRQNTPSEASWNRLSARIPLPDKRKVVAIDSHGGRN